MSLIQGIWFAVYVAILPSDETAVIPDEETTDLPPHSLYIDGLNLTIFILLLCFSIYSDYRYAKK